MQINQLNTKKKYWDPKIYFKIIKYVSIFIFLFLLYRLGKWIFFSGWVDIFLINIYLYNLSTKEITSGTIEFAVYVLNMCELEGYDIIYYFCRHWKWRKGRRKQQWRPYMRRYLDFWWNFLFWETFTTKNFKLIIMSTLANI